jgi:hypothetical protein
MPKKHCNLESHLDDFDLYGTHSRTFTVERRPKIFSYVGVFVSAIQYVMITSFLLLKLKLVAEK